MRKQSTRFKANKAWLGRINAPQYNRRKPVPNNSVGNMGFDTIACKGAKFLGGAGMVHCAIK